MAKEKIKEQLRKRQNNNDAIAKDVVLPEDHVLWDTDRIKQKKDGGTYDDLDNVRGVTPVEHMKRHGTYREREQELHELKKLIDARKKVIQQRNGSDNRTRAWKRGTDDLDEITLEWLEDSSEEQNKYLKKIDARIIKHLKSMKHPMIDVALGVKGVGPMTVAYMLVYVDIEKANYAGNLWSYVGITKSSSERYEKNVAGGGNKTLRTQLWTMADSMMKNKNCPYREVYDREKLRLSKSENLVKSRNTQGKEVRVMWKDAMKSHRHGAALRKIMKHFLADWWFVHRTVMGLPITQPYVIEYLGHKNWITPEERGWNYQ